MGLLSAFRCRLYDGFAVTAACCQWRKPHNRAFGARKCTPFGTFGTTFLLKGSMSLDSQSPVSSLRIQFLCHPEGGTLFSTQLCIHKTSAAKPPSIRRTFLHNLSTQPAADRRPQPTAKPCPCAPWARNPVRKAAPPPHIAECEENKYNRQREPDTLRRRVYDYTNGHS